MKAEKPAAASIEEHGEEERQFLPLAAE